MRIDLKNIIDESSNLSKQGKNREALSLLDNSIADSIQANRSSWVRMLSRHAAAISDSMGDLRLAKHYIEQVLTYNAEDPLSLYSLADVLFREGQTELAKEWAVKSYQLSIQRENEEARAVIELISKRWPEIQNEESVP